MSINVNGVTLKIVEVAAPACKLKADPGIPMFTLALPADARRRYELCSPQIWALQRMVIVWRQNRAQVASEQILRFRSAPTTLRKRLQGGTATPAQEALL